MPRQNLQRSENLPYHVTGRANNKETFPIPISRFWNLISDECLHSSIVYGVEIHALVLMPNHFHLILTVPEHDLGFVMNIFLRSVARKANLISGRSGHLFGGAHFRSLISGTRYFGHALKYVYRNPVKANLCQRVEEYPYSTAFGLLGNGHLPFPIFQTRVGMEIALPSVDIHGQLDWLNRPFPAEEEKMIKKGLKRNTFEELDFSMSNRNCLNRLL